MSRYVSLLLLCAFVGCHAAPVDDIDGQIVGGHDAEISEYPWQVSLRAHGGHICGGSIIDKNWILTAAHCIRADVVTSARVVTIRVGSSSPNYGGKIYQAAAIYAHPRFNRAATNQNDVGLVRLATPIENYDENARSVQLVAVGSEPQVDETLTVTGWGVKHEQDYDIPNNLQAVSLPVVSRASCAATYRRLNWRYRLDETMFCAGFSAGGKDSCQGDSGGPIVNSNNEQVGVVSWGYGCAERGIPGVYSNLANSQVRQWIRTKTGLQI